MKAKDIMSRHVITVPATAPLREVILLMLDHHISGVPVVDASGRVTGVCSEKDLLYRKKLPSGAARIYNMSDYLDSEAMATEARKAHGATAGDVMTSVPISVGEGAPVTEIVKLMCEHDVRRVLVMRSRELVGIVSKADLLKCIAGNRRLTAHAG